MRALPLLLPFLLAGCQSAESSVPVAPAKGWLATAVGRIDSASEARQLVGATDGVIDRLYVERGQAVVRGQPLLRVDCDPRVAGVYARAADAARAAASARMVNEGARTEDVSAARAGLEAAEAALRNEEQRLAQAKALIERGFVSQRELDNRTNSHDAAQANLAAARAKQDLLENGSRTSEKQAANAAANAARAETSVASALAGQCLLRSPINGHVLQILRQEGEFSGASQGTPLIMVGDLSSLTARAEVNERDAALIKPGQRAEVWVEGQKQRWPGHVTHLASVMGRRSARSLDPTDRFDRDTREAFIAFDGPLPPALVGLRVTVGFPK